MEDVEAKRGGSSERLTPRQVAAQCRLLEKPFLSTRVLKVKHRVPNAIFAHYSILELGAKKHVSIKKIREEGITPYVTYA